MQKIVIGISANCEQSGKTTVATILQHELGQTLLLPLADPLKKMVATLLQIINPSYPTDNGKFFVPELNCTVRHLWQTIGTEWGRECVGQSIWVNIARAIIQREDVVYVILPDYRFPNEGELADIHVRIESTVSPQHGHTSEGQPLGKPDYYYFNNGTLAELEAFAMRVAQDIKKKGFRLNLPSTP